MNAGQTRLHVERTGQGPPIVLTHGFGDSAETWDGQRDGLASVGTIITWDLRGHGQTGAPEHGVYDRSAALDDLRRVIGGEQAVLVGHSFGGYLSLLCAIESPELVQGLVLVATGPGFRDPDARAKWNERARALAASLDVPPGSVELVVQDDSVVIDALSQIHVPVLHVVGSRDEPFHAGHAYLDRTLPAARAVEIAGGGHMVHRTHAAEVNAEIERLLATLSRR